MKTVGKAFDRLEAVLKVISGVLLVGFVILTLVQVIMRYVFKNPLSWSEQLARYMFIWTGFPRRLRIFSGLSARR